MNLQQRKILLETLGEYMSGTGSDWEAAKKKAYTENPWFIPEFIDLAVKNISLEFLSGDRLQELADRYQLPENNPNPKIIGIVMAGNIPLVGFHDFLCVFISGHRARIKPSSKDETLISHLVEKLHEWNTEAREYVSIQPMLKNCDAYIATGSNNSARYFEYYFQKYPHIIRKNRTSVAILDGNETIQQLEELAADVYLFFGLGCRNVTKVYVPANYDFVPLLNAFRKYNHLTDHNKYKNNYDYNLAMHILNNTYYMTNESIILVEDRSPFSRISQLHYEYYENPEEVKEILRTDENIQCVVNQGGIKFGSAQTPGICNFADNVDTMAFLKNL